MSLQNALSGLDRAGIERLIAATANDDALRPQPGYQASVYVIAVAGRPLVVKSVAGQPRLGWLRRRMLRNEWRVYRHLEGLEGIPRCYGLVAGRYLLLEHIDGTPFRHLEFRQEDPVHRDLLELIQRLHARGVAHADLKRRENIILGRNRKPFIVDFGTAILRKSGFRPLNHFFFRVARQLDYHGWFKNKYRNRSMPLDPADTAYYRPMRLERAARWVRRTLRRPLGFLREHIAHK